MQYQQNGFECNQLCRSISAADFDVPDQSSEEPHQISGYTDYEITPFNVHNYVDFHDLCDSGQLSQDDNEAAELVASAEQSNEKQTCEFDSQPVCNQEFFKMLDETLASKPREIYIELLIEKTNNCEETISMYRNILVNRARKSEKCPTGPLFTRRTTKMETSSKRYANDCSALQTFIDNNDPKVLTDIFAKRRTIIKSEPTELGTPLIGLNSVRIEIAELKSQMLELTATINNLKEEQIKYKSSIAKLEKEVTDLKTKQTVVDDKLAKNVMEAPKLQTDKANKIPSLFENIRHEQHDPVDSYQTRSKDYSANLLNSKNIDSDIRRSQNTENNPPKASNKGMKKDGVTYVEKVECNSKENTSQARIEQKNIVKDDLTNHRKEITEYEPESRKTDTRDHEANKTKDALKHVSNHQRTFENPKTRETKVGKDGLTFYYTDEGMPRFTRSKQFADSSERANPPPQSKINVHITNRHSEQTYRREEQYKAGSSNPYRKQTTINSNNTSCNAYESEKPIFESVVRRKTIRYYIGGISSDSNRAGLVQFMDEHGVKPVGVRMIDTNRGSLAAKITVYATDRYIIESDIWPKKMYCRQWYGKQRWGNKFDDRFSYWDTEDQQTDVD